MDGLVKEAERADAGGDMGGTGPRRRMRRWMAGGIQWGRREGREGREGRKEEEDGVGSRGDEGVWGMEGDGESGYPAMREGDGCGCVGIMAD